MTMTPVLLACVVWWHQFEGKNKLWCVGLFGRRGARPVCLKRSKNLRQVCRTVEIAQHTVNFMANKISKGPKSINTGTKFPQDLRNLTPSTLLPLFPRSRIPVPAAGLFSLGIWEYVALEFNACFTKNTTLRSQEN